MKLAYTTTYNAQDLGAVSINEWSGTGYYIAQSLKQQSVSIEYFGPLKNSFSLQVLQKSKRHYYDAFQKRYIKNIEPLTIRSFANQISKKLSETRVDAVFSATINPIAYLECQQPIVFWADATFANIIDFYPQYSNLCHESVENGHLMERAAIHNSKLAIYSSEWAAQKAIEFYQADPAKVKVVPFGANIENSKTLYEIKDLIDSRPLTRCKLLFIGVDWFRKGGDVALKVAYQLNNLGLNTELTVIGSQPVAEGSLPSFVKPLGFISKSTREGKERIQQLIGESHFLILPSLADCSPIVLCEANSLGVPCLSTKVGGIPTIIKTGLNGELFDKEAEVLEYCKYIVHLFTNYKEYKALALSAFNEYQTRLNWEVAGQTVKQLLREKIF
ncbi:glycosyltransferase family 4 protein [Scytonema millei]|uniref:Glycosyltransferase family 4 protein n=1 Tax=Scytonema millei VB511283 TaxID=1245923 RepID=A0A9X5E2G6_9CYAN|nr:glycosyltransferase family 4 protein [Scytonema millei]NHC33847.1 glycosyltransferase family 4 protein [Scytonema millei VB511283]